jgi:hypothetical protein
LAGTALVIQYGLGVKNNKVLAYLRQQCRMRKFRAVAMVACLVMLASVSIFGQDSQFSVPVVPHVPPTRAQPNTGKPSKKPAAVDPGANEPTNAADVCPSMKGLYPVLGTLPTGLETYRTWYGKPWQSDYPALIFDASTGRLYWNEPPTPKSQEILFGLPQQSVTFSPITYTTEKILIWVCKAKFSSKITVSEADIALNDPLQQDLYAPSEVAAAAANADAFVQHGVGHDRPRPPIPSCPVATSDKLSTAVATLSLKLDQAQILYRTQKFIKPSGSSTFPATDLIADYVSSDGKAPKIDIAADATKERSNPRLYNNIQRQVAVDGKQLDTYISDYNAFIGDQSFKDLSKAAKDAQTAMNEYDKTPGCTVTAAQRISFAAYTEFKADLADAKKSLQDASLVIQQADAILEKWYEASSVDTVQVMTQATSSTLTVVTFTLTDGDAKTTNDPADEKTTDKKATVSSDMKKQGGAAAPKPTVDTNVVVTMGNLKPTSETSQTATAADATVLVERHRIIHFVPTGGFLGIRATSMSYASETLPTTINTTTTITGPATGQGSTTIATSSGTSTYAIGTRSGPIQQGAVLGLTWYPLGHDTYPVTQLGKKIPIRTSSYFGYSPWSRLGVFMGTTVNTLGNFVISPSYEIFNGVELFAGLTVATKTTLGQNIVACGSLGNNTVETSNTTSTATDSTGTTTTQVVVDTTYGCKTSNATLLNTGATIPTSTQIVPAFGFGILLNSNLLKYFSPSK